MKTFESRWNPESPAAQQRRAAMLARLASLRALEERAAHASAQSLPVFERRGQLLPRQRVALLLDAGTPWLPLSALAGYLHDVKDPDKSVPGGGVVAGIGWVCGVRCMVVASDSGIEAGAVQPMGLEKILHLQEIALQNKLPFLHLVESAGANLMRYRVEVFVHGGALFRNLARLSAAGIPVITVQHGSGTAGGAYMPGLSDVVILVEGRSRAFLAGPPLLQAATGEIATEEELGGALMHATLSGLGEYLAQDDREAIGIARDVVASLGWASALAPAQEQAPAPTLAADDLLGLIPDDLRQPVDMREVIARLADDSELSEFRPAYGPATVCATGFLEGHATAFITNNGPLDPQGSTKAAQFIQLCDQAGTPIVYLQNTTGFIVGRASEEAGMIKHGAKLIQALTNARVPQITIMCGASFGAGNYGMCGRAFEPRFAFSWPNAKSAVMGGEQAAATMAMVAQAGAQRRGKPLDLDALERDKREIIDNFERQSGALHTSGLLLDDAIIDPRDTRTVLAIVLATCREADARVLRPVQYGVARF